MTSGLQTFNSLYEELSTQLRSTGNIRRISEEFANLKNDRSRVNFTLNLKSVHDVIKLNDDCAGKSNVDSLKFKDLGNKQFQKGVYNEAIKLYTKSIAYAPSKGTSTTLAISYANRSAALFYEGYYKISLRDINRAFESQYPQDMYYKLYERKGKCYRKLEENDLAVESFRKALSLLPDASLSEKKISTLQKDIDGQIKECLLPKEDTDLKNLTISGDNLNGAVPDSLPDLKTGVHDIFTSLSDACDIAYTEQQGRYVVARRDLNPGEVVLVEKPFASVLLYENSLSHCHHCFKGVIAPIASDYSCLVVFCSTECMAEAKTYHTFEWQSLDVIAKSGVGKFGYLALRSMTKYGPEYFLRFKDKLDNGKYITESDKFQGCATNGKYEAMEYNAIYNLVTHDKDRTVYDLFRRSVIAVFLLKCLEKGNFFEIDNKDIDEKDFRVFIGGLLLSHLQAYPCNAHEISELELLKDDIAGSVSREIGAGIYSTLSLFNHSCDPVVNRNFYGDVCVVRTIKGVKQGQEISDNYGAIYAVHSLVERREKLTPQYYFTCTCQACVNQWPLYPDINSKTPVWKCSNCQSVLLQSGNDPANVTCKTCNLQANLYRKVEELEKSKDQYSQAFTHLLEGKVQKALPVFLGHLKTLDKLLHCPWQDFNNCQESIKQCFSIMGNHAKM